MGTKAIFKTAMVAIAALFSNSMAQSGNANYTESNVAVTGSQKSLDMVFVKGGTYDRGCSANDTKCVEGEKPVHKVTLSDYYVGKYEVTNAQWTAVMGGEASKPLYPGAPSVDNQPKTGITWYDAIEFTCKLKEKTGIRYRLLTDAEFEYAARGGEKTHGYLYSGSNDAGDVAWTKDNSGSGYGAKDVGGKAANELGIFDMSGNVYEWMLDSWQSTYLSGDKVNPVYKPTVHTQKTRRGGSYDQAASESRVSARKIRSIEGKDGSIGFRLARSVNDNDPAAQLDPCTITQPFPTGAKIDFRDLRIATADDEAWIYDMGEYSSGMGYVLRLSPNGTARYAMIMNYNGSQFITDQASGEWYTVNGFSLYIVPNSGAEKKYLYLPLCKEHCDNMSMMPEAGMPGRYVRMKLSDLAGAEKVTLPTISSPKTLEVLASGKTNIDMANPPKTGHDPRVKEGDGYAWIQDNVKMGAGGTHRYRKDFESDSDMRFVVWDAGAGSSTLLAHGPWFTVDNSFLRVNDPNGQTYDYLYTVTKNNDTLYHISFQAYEPGDFRMFMKTKESEVPQWIEPGKDTYNQGSSKYIPPTENGTPAPGVTPILSNIAKNNFAMQTKNAVNLQVEKGAIVEIYCIKGNLISRQNYTSGTHTISLTNLPKGMYLVKVRFGGSDVKILRVPVL
jgi:formylglycine-generating enzyme required for sulfatase activity